MIEALIICPSLVRPTDPHDADSSSTPRPTTPSSNCSGWPSATSNTTRPPTRHREGPAHQPAQGPTPPGRRRHHQRLESRPRRPHPRLPPTASPPTSTNPFIDQLTQTP